MNSYRGLTKLKPRILLNRAAQEVARTWGCYGGGVWGHGSIPAAAFSDWFAKLVEMRFNQYILDSADQLAVKVLKGESV